MPRLKGTAQKHTVNLKLAGKMITMTYDELRTLLEDEKMPRVGNYEVRLPSVSATCQEHMFRWFTDRVVPDQHDELAEMAVCACALKLTALQQQIAAKITSGSA